MRLTFYKYAGTPNRIDKTSYLTEIGSVSNVNLKSTTDFVIGSRINWISEKARFVMPESMPTIISGESTGISSGVAR